MGKRNRNKKRGEQPDYREAMWINLGHDVGDRMNGYVDANGISDKNLGIREVLNKGLFADPTLAIDSTYRHSALAATRAQVVAAIHQFFNDLHSRLNSELEYSATQRALTQEQPKKDAAWK